MLFILRWTFLCFLAISINGYVHPIGKTRTGLSFSKAATFPRASTLSRLEASRQPLQGGRSKVFNYETFGDAALSEETFGQLYSPHGIPFWLAKRCEELGWKHPTLVQQRSMDAIFEGKDVVIQSQTGSGKTLAYLLPLLAIIDPSRASIQALIVVPTRELGLQVARIAKRLAAGMQQTEKKILIMNILQGSQLKRQRAWAWAEPPQIVIGTPEELTNMVRYGGIRYNAVKYVVVDEVDACLLNNAGTMTFKLSSSGPLHELLSRHLSPSFDTPEKTETETEQFMFETLNYHRPICKERQTIFCSATIPQHRHFLKQCVQNKWTIKEPIHICASPGELIPPSLKHTYLVSISEQKKFSALRRLIATKLPLKSTKVLIFCEPNRPMEEMAAALAKDLGGIFWEEHFGTAEDESAGAIVSVLRYEDSLSKRASAMLGFQGSGGGAIEGRRFAGEDREKWGQLEEEIQAQPDSKPRVLLSTDLAARGLDVIDISHVINYDMPRDADTYVHRGGRAGRLGRKGTVVSVVTKGQEFVLDRICNSLSLDTKCIGRQKTPKRRKLEP